MENKKKSNQKAIIAVGVSAVLLTAVLVTVAVLYPSLKAKSALRNITDRLSDSAVKIATVYDPDEGQNLFEEGGVERIASDSERERLSELILKITDGASYSSRDTKEIFFDYGFRIRFRLSSDESVGFFISDGFFYITSNGVRYFFTPGDEDAYLELITLAHSIIKSETP